MTKVTWNNEWNTGVEIIDRQHKKLIDILNRISEGSIDDKELIKELINYVSSHFFEEEKLMFKNNYPYDLYKWHRKQHNDFTDAMLDISFKIISMDKTDVDFKSIIKKLEEFCFTWFKEHFLKTDKILADFINGGENIDHILDK